MLKAQIKKYLNECHTLVAASRTQMPLQMALAITLAAIAAFCCGQPASAQCQYEVTAVIQHICPDFGDGSPTFGQGMNSHGDVVGYYWPCVVGNERAFFWSEDTGFVTLPTPPGVVLAWAYDINDNRIIVGQHSIPGVGRMGFVYDMNKNNGVYQYLNRSMMVSWRRTSPARTRSTTAASWRACG
jgi:hypothetical protein